MKQLKQYKFQQIIKQVSTVLSVTTTQMLEWFVRPWPPQFARYPQNRIFLSTDS